MRTLRWLGLIGVVCFSGCGSDSNGRSECSPSAAYKEILAGADATDCGPFEPAGDGGTKDVDLPTAEACVLQAQEQGKPFIFAYERFGSDSKLVDAFVWAGPGHEAVFLSYDSGLGRARFEQGRCTQVSLTLDCTASKDHLCLVCNDDGRLTPYCEAPQDE